jgi:hypothetical protein
MSSPISPALADYREALPAALAEVAEFSLFTFVDVSDSAAFFAAAALPIADGGCDWIRADVDFTGVRAGHFAITVPETLARRLCASFAGAETDAPIADRGLLDFTGELANMVCGTWLTRSCRHEAFSLTPPRVRRERPGPAQPSGDRCDPFYLSLDDAPIRLEIHWAGSPASSQEPAGGRAGTVKESTWPSR